MKNLLTIDVEEWYNFIGDEAVPPFDTWVNLESRVERWTDRLLEIIDGYKATFFILGFTAEHHPGMVKKISSMGHEIACHGYRHDFVFDMGPQRFREDVSRSKALLEEITGQPCLGYRSPGFSIRKQDLWALEIIHELGFKYDASIFPAVRTFGGVSGFNKFPHRLQLERGSLIEIPVSASRILGINTVFCGGGFFRFFPEWYIHSNINKINRSDQPAVIYIHPRDIDPGQPRLPLKFINRFLYYYGLGEAEEKFIRLIRAFEWGSIREYIGSRTFEG